MNALLATYLLLILLLLVLLAIFEDDGPFA